MDFNFDFDRQERREKGMKLFFKLLRWAIALAITVIAARMVVKYCVEITNMVGTSMEATLFNDDTILINKMAYVKKDPERFDIIVFEKSGKEHSYYSVKRIIGLPGETVQIIGGYIYINGNVIEDIIVVEPVKLSGLASEPIVLDEDEYFVLGDNRNDSEDSRFANVGNVFRSEIKGTAWLRLNRFGIISKINLKENQE